MEHYKHVIKPIKDLIPYARNSKIHTDKQINQIASSMKEFGFTNPVLIDEKDGIIAGHGRILAADKLKYKDAPCIILSGLTEAQKRAYVIADNKIAENAGWDEEMLKLEIMDLNGLNFDLDILGFDKDELDDLLDLGGNNDGNTDPDDIPEPPTDPVSKPGDIWTLGDHRLMCGDSTDHDAVAEMMDGDLADQLITDPPYNVDYVGKTKEALTIQNDSMDDSSFLQFLIDLYKSADNVMKPGAVFYIWHADSEGYNFRGAAKAIGWVVRQCIIWNKDSMVLGRQDYHWKHEPCLYGWKEGAGHLWNSDRKQTTILNFVRPKRNDLHPTMKPVDLIVYQIENNTKGKDVVLDLCGGSGTTLMAGEKTGRCARIMELDPVYCDVIINRWQDYTGLDAINKKSGKTYNDCLKPLEE